jgi:hypothetical protein
MTWKTILSFVLLAIFVMSIVGWRTVAEILPLRQGFQGSDAECNFLPI